MRHGVLLGLKILFAAILLGVLFRVVPLNDVRHALALASGPLFAAGVALQFANRALATLPLKVITASQGIALARGSLFRILLAVQFYSLFLPGALAGGGATFLKYVEYGAAKGAAATAIVINRGVSLMVLLSVVPIAVALDPHLDVFPQALTLGVAGTAAVVVVLFGSAGPPGSRRAGANANRFTRGAARLMHGFATFHRLPGRNKVAVLAGAATCELGNAAAMWMFARAVGVPVDFLSVIWIRGLLQLALLLPFSVAGLGVREASLVGLGVLAGVPAAGAIAWSFAILAGSIGVALAGGLLEAAGWLRSHGGRTTGSTQ